MRLLRLLLASGTLLLVGAAASLWLPYGGGAADSFVDIPRGTASTAVAGGCLMPVWFATGGSSWPCACCARAPAFRPASTASAGP